MALRAPGDDDDDLDEQFVSDLVKKSLAVNPGLKRGMRTQQFLEQMRQKAAAAAKGSAAAGKAAPAPQKPAGPREDRRVRTITTFFEQTNEIFEERATDLKARKTALEQEELALKKQTTEDIIDLMSVVAAGMPLPNLDALFTRFRPLLSKLGVTDRDILKALRQK